MEIPPRSEKLVVYRLNVPPSSDIGMVEGDNMLLEKGILVVAAVRKPSTDNCAPVRLLNTSSELFRLPLGMQLGWYRSIDETQVGPETVAEVGRYEVSHGSRPGSEATTLTVSSVPDHVKSLYDSVVKVCSPSEKVKVAEPLPLPFSDVFSKDEADVGRTHLVSQCSPYLWSSANQATCQVVGTRQRGGKTGLRSTEAWFDRARNSGLVFACSSGEEKGWIIQVMCRLPETEFHYIRLRLPAAADR